MGHERFDVFVPQWLDAYDGIEHELIVRVDGDSVRPICGENVLRIDRNEADPVRIDDVESP